MSGSARAAGAGVLGTNADAGTGAGGRFEGVSTGLVANATAQAGTAVLAQGAPQPAGLKVSWQLTGIRKDAWAQAHRIPVEHDKPAGERGRYLHPELYGAGLDAAVRVQAR